MTKYIRGFRQLEALYLFVECFLKRNFMCAKRELEIFFGFAVPYAVYTTPLFNTQYKEMFGDQALLDLLIDLEKHNEQIEEKG